MPGNDRARGARSRRAFRVLLTLYPGEFRDEYGREMSLVFTDRYRDATGPFARLVVWIEAIVGVLREAPKEHVRMILKDLRYAARIARRSPGFTLTAVMTLALGIGANTAIFQLIDAVMLRSLPVRNPAELVEVRIAGGNKGFGITTSAYGELTRPVWLEVRRSQQAFSGAFAWAPRNLRIGEGSELRRASGIAVSAEFFSVLGVEPFRGQFLDATDEASACPSTRAVVSYGFWQRGMGSRTLDRDARLTIDGQWHEIIGVTPPGFLGLAVGDSFDIALPLCSPRELRRELFEVTVIGRLRPGWSTDRASAHLAALSPGIFESTVPSGYSSAGTEQFKGFKMAAYPAATGVSELRGQYDLALRLLLGITGLVLVIASANLANLMLARAAAREREVAVRLSLGASRFTLLRQFLAESALLALLGAGIGIGLAQILSRGLVWALSTADGAPALVLATNWRVLLFTALVAVAACVVFGLAPAVRATRVRLAGAMSEEGRGSTGSRRRLTTQRVMVITQIAVSLVLLVAALLFVRSFRNLVTADAGMRQDGISVAFIAFPALKIPRDELNAFHRRLLIEARSVPGILSVGTTTRVPLLGGSWSHGVRVGDIASDSQFTWVSPGYFETMDIRMLRGRDFTWQDTRTSPRVAVVNETFVRRFVASGDALGQKLRTSPEPDYPSTEYEIVGVIPDTQYNDLRGSKRPMVFAPDSQLPTIGPGTAMMIYSKLDPAVAVASVKTRLIQEHPGLVAESLVLKARVREGLLRERLLAMLAGFFGALAVVMTTVGLYGMMAFAVTERRREIGIRVALGAQRSQVVGMVMRESGWLLAAGLIVGATVSLWAGRSTASMLFGVTPDDPATLLAAGLLLSAIAAIASFMPARRASRMDPVKAMRQD